MLVPWFVQKTTHMEGPCDNGGTNIRTRTPNRFLLLPNGKDGYASATQLKGVILFAFYHGDLVWFWDTTFLSRILATQFLFASTFKRFAFIDLLTLEKRATKIAKVLLKGFHRSKDKISYASLDSLISVGVWHLHASGIRKDIEKCASFLLLLCSSLLSIIESERVPWYSSYVLFPLSLLPFGWRYVELDWKVESHFDDFWHLAPPRWRKRLRTLRTDHDL
jgi:hypothetical protein